MDILIELLSGYGQTIHDVIMPKTRNIISIILIMQLLVTFLVFFIGMYVYRYIDNQNKYSDVKELKREENFYILTLIAFSVVVNLVFLIVITETTEVASYENEIVMYKELGLHEQLSKDKEIIQSEITKLELSEVEYRKLVDTYVNIQNMRHLGKVYVDMLEFKEELYSLYYSDDVDTFKGLSGR